MPILEMFMTTGHDITMRILFILLLISFTFTSYGRPVPRSTDAGAEELIPVKRTLPVKKPLPVRRTQPIIAPKASLQKLKSSTPFNELNEEDTVHESIATPEQLTKISDRGWKLTFADEFTPAEEAIKNGADAKCFNMTPGCMPIPWGRADCPEHAAQLKNLNKCNWDVYAFYNYMDFEAAKGEGINAFHPNQVEVSGGTLKLHAVKSNFSKIDCKNDFSDPRLGGLTNQSDKCPILSGGLESRTRELPDGSRKGFSQSYGRFESRAKLSHGTGSWPAIWILAEEGIFVKGKECGWPQSGEIDLMESWSDKPSEVTSTLHSGDCTIGNKVSTGFDFKATEKWYPNMSRDEREKTFWKDFHTYAVEWDPVKIRFYIDDIMIGQLTHGDTIKKLFKEKKKINIPYVPFQWLLNNSIYRDKKKDIDPTKTPFMKQTFEIDYVRTYRECTASDSGCVTFKYKNLGEACPGPREYLGDYQKKSVCKAFPHSGISQAHCNGKGGFVANGKCLIDEGAWWKARYIKRECPWPRKHLGDYNDQPVCKALPHFKIKSRKCDGIKWNGYCIWQEKGFFRARELK